MDIFRTNIRSIFYSSLLFEWVVYSDLCARHLFAQSINRIFITSGNLVALNLIACIYFRPV
jgi:hypothetical protein